ncbi:MAG: DUF192 domain-containing protein [Actinomycetota bacterium]
MRSINLLLNDGTLLRARVAVTPRERTRGLLGWRRLGDDEALLIPGARSIHTFGMRFPIVAAWLDADHRVVGTRRLEPGRIAWGMRGARHVLECADGTTIEPGHVIEAAGTDSWVREPAP